MVSTYLVINLTKNRREVTSFLIVIVGVFRAVLSTGFRGSACWSTRSLPTPHYPCPFGTPSVSALLRWLFLTMVQTYLHIPTHELLLDVYQIRLPVFNTFHPRFKDWWLVATLGDTVLWLALCVLSLLHLEGGTWIRFSNLTHMTIKLSRFSCFLRVILYPFQG